MEVTHTLDVSNKDFKDTTIKSILISNYEYVQTNGKLYKVMKDTKEREILAMKITIIKILKTLIVSTTEWREQRKE